MIGFFHNLQKMSLSRISLIVIAILIHRTASENNPLADFPDDFIFAVSTSAYQIEGSAFNESGRGWSIWDTMTHSEPWLIEDSSTGDVACDSYHKYKEDVRNIRDIGFKVYRFSVSWSRIFPRGTVDMINEAGVQYYHNLIDELQANGIEPMVTMYHWDLPQALQNEGGWLNDRIVTHFENYADFLFKTYGAKVKWWITINDPSNVAAGYCGTTAAPAVNLCEYGEYLVGHNAIKAHARAYRLYQEKYKHFGGKISITLSIEGHIPLSNSTENEAAAERGLQCTTGWFGNPIHSKKGDYHDILKAQVSKKSRNGNVSNRLPQFTQQEIDYIKGTADFIALNHYTSRLVSPGHDDNIKTSSNSNDAEVNLQIDPRWPTSPSSWLFMVPKGIRLALNWIKRTYGNKEVFFTEGGFSDDGESLSDTPRILYYKSYLEELKEAINKDGCPVIGYTAWSLMDNFEWTTGYTQKFGLIHVDFSSSSRTRTFKDSAWWFKDVLHKREIARMNTSDQVRLEKEL